MSITARATGTVAMARRRHPSARAIADRSGLRNRVADAFERDGVPHPEVATAILAVRGVSGLDQAAFARRAGVDIAELVAAEQGEVERGRLPSGLRPMVPR